MADTVDDEGVPLFDDVFEHAVHEIDGTSIDVIKTNGNLWLSGPAAMEAMGFQSDSAKGGYARRLARIDHPDIIKITDTPFRFKDGRRNRGSLISPRAIHRFAEGKVKGFNPIKSYAFLQWMEEHLWSEGNEETWSPARPAPTKAEPLFRSVVNATNENQRGEQLDPLRPVGLYLPMHRKIPLSNDEMEFCLCCDARVGLGRCWCGGKGLIRGALAASYSPYAGVEVIDEDDDFSPLTAWQKVAA